MDEHMIDETGSLSRRTLLKRVGAGAAFAWSAPVLMSISVPASAASPEPSVCRQCCVNCGDFPCPSGPSCFCLTTVEGDCFCMQQSQCSAIPSCTTSADCPPGWRCEDATSSCGRVVCVPPCGTSAGAAAGPSTPPLRNS